MLMKLWHQLLDLVVKAGNLIHKCLVLSVGWLWLLVDHWIFFLQKPVRFYNVWLEFPVILVNVLITMLDNSLLVSWEGLAVLAGYSGIHFDY
jgi:hypothetical protein